MAMIKCEECGNMIPSYSKTCPECGCPVAPTITCEECGAIISANSKICPECGCPVGAKIQKPITTPNSNIKNELSATGSNKNTISKGNTKMDKKPIVWTLIILALCLYIASAVMLSKGHDKMTSYYNSDYSSYTKNAYVGGDAYNYIINGNYATGFFVLASGFLITGTLLIGIALVIVYIPNNTSKPIVIERQPVEVEELPDI